VPATRAPASSEGVRGGVFSAVAAVDRAERLELLLCGRLVFIDPRASDARSLSEGPGEMRPGVKAGVARRALSIKS
jgi:hypothetical protein